MAHIELNIKKLQEVIERAIKNGNWLKFDYVSEKFEITSRLVDPKEINNFKLVAMDIGRAGLRQFQFDGIQKLTVVDKGETHA